MCQISRFFNYVIGSSAKKLLRLSDTTMFSKFVHGVWYVSLFSTFPKYVIMRKDLLQTGNSAIGP